MAAPGTLVAMRKSDAEHLQEFRGGVDQSCDSCGDGRPYQTVKYRKHTVALFFLMRQLLARETIIVVTMFAIRLGEDAVAEIAGLRAAERRRILDAIEKQLAQRTSRKE
jgi:hypothetical protein